MISHKKYDGKTVVISYFSPLSPAERVFWFHLALTVQKKNFLISPKNRKEDIHSSEREKEIYTGNVELPEMFVFESVHRI